MFISEALFNRIVCSPASNVQEKTAVLPVGCRRAPERRGAVRVSFGKRCQIRRDGGAASAAWTTVLVKDLSLGGLAFLCENAVQTGESFVLRLAHGDGSLLRIRCIARRCEVGGFGGVAFLVGASFEQLLEQSSIRLNDDDGKNTDWDDARELSSAGVHTDARGIGRKSNRGGIVRAAISLVKAVDPIRNAAQWMRRNDDFSSN